MSFYRDKKAALEMSMTTIVTIVLVVVTLVLALVLIRTIFTGSTSAITSVNTEIQNQINQLFASNSNTNLEIAPIGGQINVQRGTPSGFAFSIKNTEQTTATFSYTVNATDVHLCGSSITLDQANYDILHGSGQFSVGPGDISGGIAVLFSFPTSSPACPIVYSLQVNEIIPNQNVVIGSPGTIFVTVQ